MKPYIEFNTQKIIEQEESNDKNVKTYCKLMNNAVYGKTMESLRNRINVKLTNNEKDYLYIKMYIKTKLYVAQNIWQ